MVRSLVWSRRIVDEVVKTSEQERGLLTPNKIIYIHYVLYNLTYPTKVLESIY